nr:HD-GYP domain-containing protein [uncultured Caproiciproducens sp.]
MENGLYLVLLIMLPLLLARYSFVLYLEAKKNYYNMVKTLTAALEAKDKYTEGHSHRVEDYAELIARKMHCSQGEIEDIRVAALLHDIGKIGIDEKILNKPGPLTPEERKVIMTHPQISASILKNVKLNNAVREAILHHHERYDGGGYPDHTKGDEIHIAIYIIGVADAYDAMTSDRPYCSSIPIERVVEILKEESGKQFHPKVVSAFLEVLHTKGEI